MATLSTPIQEMEFHTRAMRAMYVNDIRTLGDVIATGRYGISKLPNVGKSTVTHIADVVESYGFELSLHGDMPLVDSNGIMHIGYDRHKGMVFPEAAVEQNINRLIATGQFFTVGGQNEVAYIQVLVKRGVIKDVVFLFEGKEIIADNDGNLLSSPEGFADYLSGWLMELF